MTSSINAADLRRETPATLATRTDGKPDRQVLIELAVAAMEAAEDAAYRLRVYLADGATGHPMATPEAPTDQDRDLLLMAAMVAADNAAKLAGAARTRQHIERGSGWDPLKTFPRR